MTSFASDDMMPDGPSWPPLSAEQTAAVVDHADEVISDVALLVRAAASGDQRAWDDLVDRFSSTVWAIARSHRLNSADAADVFQTAWMRLFENLHRIEQPERVGAWLATTTKRECLRVIRLSSRQVLSADIIEAAYDDPAFTAPEIRMLAEQRRVLVNELIDQLPQRSRLLLRLLSADSPLSYKEISEALSMPIGSIGPTRVRALQQLRRLAEARGVSIEDIFTA